MLIEAMTRKDFESVPRRDWNEDIGEIDSLVILPASVSTGDVVKFKIRTFFAKVTRLNKPNIWEIKGLHDSGYRCMDFIAIRGREPLCRLSGCSDVIHIEGIGGFGHNWLEKHGAVPTAIPPSGWSMDCLPTSGLLRLFCDTKLVVGAALSSFEVYSIGKKR